uniref:Proprotein convertase subtilisin/kexin type 7-like n=1 Tax=Phallusia mammillata TaxID=59560 RepID=A0A6F9DP88_9ASCI|nr:proprotein convertase subtilisin/kexin type 7-like [Phallusia mammillata]
MVCLFFVGVQLLVLTIVKAELHILPTINSYLQTHKTSSLSYTWSVKLNSDSSQEKDSLILEANYVANELGFINLGQVGELKGYYVFVPNDTRSSNKQMLDHPKIEWTEHQEILKRDKRRFINNKNKLFDMSSFRDPLFQEQWHLYNSKASGLDCNVTGVWGMGITGKGVVVAIIDDGVEWRHPDLKDNYCANGSFDLNSDDDDPSPEYDKAEENKHGTRCAGEISAVRNSVCGVGIAYDSRFSGIRILDGPMTDSLEATAFNKHMDVNDVYSCSWGPEDDGKTVDGPRNLAQTALKHGIVAGRSGFGSVFVVASGNGGDNDDNCNYDGYANSIYTITIGAINEYGQTPSYAEQCTSMLACTVSSGAPGRSIATTDWTLGHRSQQCTTQHTGTSAATPLAAGMIALMLEVRPCLQWRDIQHIIVLTSIPLNSDKYASSAKDNWVQNAAGFFHSNQHGFGQLNAWRLVNAAKVWESVPWLTTYQPTCPGHNLAIVKSVTKPLTVECQVSVQQSLDHMINTLESVLVTVNVKHSFRGSLKFVIVCPSGTESIIFPRKKDKSDAGLSDWTFMTVKCWGESSYGKYQLKIYDTSRKQAKVNVLKSWQIQIYGSNLTTSDIANRQKMLQNSFSGNINANFSCPAGTPLLFDVTEALSERTLHLLVLLSFFFVFWGVYYSLDLAFCYKEEEENK